MYRWEVTFGDGRLVLYPAVKDITLELGLSRYAVESLARDTNPSPCVQRKAGNVGVKRIAAVHKGCDGVPIPVLPRRQWYCRHPGNATPSLGVQVQ